VYLLQGPLDQLPVLEFVVDTLVVANLTHAHCHHVVRGMVRSSSMAGGLGRGARWHGAPSKSRSWIPCLVSLLSSLAML
jgi:hypothetical protein